MRKKTIAISLILVILASIFVLGMRIKKVMRDNSITLDEIKVCYLLAKINNDEISGDLKSLDSGLKKFQKITIRKKEIQKLIDENENLSKDFNKTNPDFSKVETMLSAIEKDKKRDTVYARDHLLGLLSGITIKHADISEKQKEIQILFIVELSKKFGMEWLSKQRDFKLKPKTFSI